MFIVGSRMQIILKVAKGLISPHWTSGEMPWVHGWLRNNESQVILYWYVCLNNFLWIVGSEVIRSHLTKFSYLKRYFEKVYVLFHHPYLLLRQELPRKRLYDLDKESQHH